MSGCEEIQYYQFALGFVLLVGAFFYYRQYSKLQQVTESESKLIDEVYFDSLTNLPNHKNIDIILNDQISRCQRHNKSFFIAYIKINNINEIFRTSSKEHGNKIIQKAADQIYTCIRNEDMVGHITRDNFIIIFNEYLEENKLEHIFKRLHDSLKNDFDISIGISKFPNDSQDAQSLISCSVKAIKKVNENDKYNFHLYKQES
jgi:diguanylate cyclase (GGDEF)-like protein